MAYTAVISLLHTLEQLQQRDPQLIQGQTAQTLKSLYATADFFRKAVEKASKTNVEPEKIKDLEEKIRTAANDAEDVIELKISQIKGSTWKTVTACKILHKNLLSIVEKIDTTKKQVEQIVSDFGKSTNADDEIPKSGESRIGTSSRSDQIPYVEDATVGLDDDLEKIVKRLTGPPSDLGIITISGMGGIGKTTVARKAHDHLTTRYHFDIRVWLTISQEFQPRTVLLDALHCISKQTNIVYRKGHDKKGDDKQHESVDLSKEIKKDDDQLTDNIFEEIDDDELADLVQKNLKGRRYLAVVDDIWSTDVWDSIRGIFPDYNNGSRILLTTRETEVAKYANPTSTHEMNLLNIDNGWKLLRDKVFGQENHHPLELKETGKLIVEKCQGLPLTIKVIAGHLSKISRTLQSWEDVAQTLSDIIASQPDKCLGVLGLSYHHLPNHLKPCMLSMGGFPEDYEVETWRLIQLWLAEGFIRTEGRKRLEEVAKDHLEDLISRNLITVRKRRFNGEIKVCGIHDLLHEFCLIEAEKINFMHVVKTCQVPAHPTKMHNIRRFSFTTHTCSADSWKLSPLLTRSFYVFSLSMMESRSPLSRSAIFARFNLLRVLAIFDYRFHSFPIEVTKLFHLRYLAVRSDDYLPASISELQNLQTLIVSAYSTLPGEIWMLKNMRHMHLDRSSYLPSPSSVRRILNKYLVTGMPNLEEFSALCFSSGTNEVFSRIHNLKRLILRERLSESRSEDMHECLIDMSTLKKLEALKCLYHIKSEHSQLNSIKRFVFPTSLKRMTLSGSHFPWEDISILAMLPYLEELKLKNHAFTGEVWKLQNEEKFEKLKLLLIGSTDLKIWEACSDSFPNLKRLVLKNCFNLERIPTEFGEIYTLGSIELHDCSTSAEDSAREIEQEQEEMGNNCLKVNILGSRRN